MCNRCVDYDDSFDDEDDIFETAPVQNDQKKRLEQALRENLKRRKGQMKARKTLPEGQSTITFRKQG